MHHGRIGFLAGLLIRDFEQWLVLNTIARTSHKSKRPVHYIVEAELLDSGEGIDEGKLLVKVYRTFLDVDVDHLVFLYSKDLFTTLYICRNYIDKSIRADVSVIRY